MSLPSSVLAASVIRRIPASIDQTGKTDVTARLQQFIASLPDGATVVFPHGARYRLDGTLELDGRTDLTLDGNGAILFAGTHGGPTRAEIRLVDGTNWTIRDLRIRGSNHAEGTFNPRYQWQHGIDLRGVQGAVIKNVTVTNVFGDDIYIGLSTSSAARWSRDVSVIDSTGIGSGRMAVSITGGRNITIRGGFWSKPGLSTFDLEPNGPTGGAEEVVIEDGRIGEGARASALTIAGDGPVSNVVFQRMKLTGRPLTVLVDQHTFRPKHIVVRRNVSNVRFTGPQPAAMFFRNVDGVTITGNVQPLQPATGLALVATKGCTEVNVSREQSYLQLGSGSTLTPVIVGLGASLCLLVLSLVWRRER